MRTRNYCPNASAPSSFIDCELTTNERHSPHFLLPNIKASILIAIVDNDDQKDPTSKDVLRKPYDDPKVSAEIKVYNGANHR
jgi:carboxymethylenebutenolidase